MLVSRVEPESSIFSAIIVKIIYGVEVEDENDPNVAQLIRVMKNVQGFVSGRFYVQYFPFLRHVPLWVPILGSQLRELEEGRAVMEEVKQAMFDKTLDDLVSVFQGVKDSVPA